MKHTIRILSALTAAMMLLTSAACTNPGDEPGESATDASAETETLDEASQALAELGDVDWGGGEFAILYNLTEKNELEAVRPELLYVLKVLLGLGGLVLSAYLILQFSADSFKVAIAVIVFSLLSIIVLMRPEIIGVKAGYPTNCVEEAVTLILMPVRFVLAMMTFLIGIATIGGLIYGLIAIFDNGLEAILYLDVTTVVPLFAPLAVYFAYLNIMFFLDLYRAVVSIPRKLDEFRKA